MPSDYYYNWADNFFKKMTDLDSPRKNNDCYFYYYSTCSKGDNCTFRHEPSALGSETVCSFWKEGKCVNVHCNFRHMELRKNRKSIPCYWESQPGGCLKPHCSFMHQRASVKLNDGRTVVVAQDNNADSESDNDYPCISSPSYRPSSFDRTERIVKVKTLEEIKLEKIQAESAAYYSYPGSEQIHEEIKVDVENDLRSRINRYHNNNNSGPDRTFNPFVENDKRIITSTGLQNIKIKSLSEIKGNRKGKETKSHSDGDSQEASSESSPARSVNIKSLSEIKRNRRGKEDKSHSDGEAKEVSREEIRKRAHSPIVFSTTYSSEKSGDEVEQVSSSRIVSETLPKKIRLCRKQPKSDDNGKSFNFTIRRKSKNVPKEISAMEVETSMKTSETGLVVNPEDSSSSSSGAGVGVIESNATSETRIKRQSNSDPSEIIACNNTPVISNKTIEEVLLLEDDDEDLSSDISLEGKEGFLNDESLDF